MEIRSYDGKAIRLTTTDGEVFEGRAEHCHEEYGLHVFNREEESVRLGEYYLFRSEIRSIEPIGEDEFCGFYGAERVAPEIRQLYRDLKQLWCLETCAPRLRSEWSADNPSLGQCSITAFLVQDLFGGRVLGVPFPGGGFHCFNELGDHRFDLTSEQFGEDADLDYERCPEQRRETHFADGDKYARYLLLKKRLGQYRAR